MFRQGTGSQGEVGLPSPRCEANEKRGPGRPGGPPNKKAILQGPPSGAEGFLEISQGPPERRPGTVFEQQSGGERRPVSLSGRSLISYRRGFRKPGTGLLSRACQQKSRQCRYAWQNDFQEPCSLETYGVAFLHVIFEGISALSGCSMGPEPIFLPSRISGLPKTPGTVFTFAGRRGPKPSSQPPSTLPKVKSSS